MANGYTKPITEVIEELKEELKEFVATRLAMLRSELNEKYQSLKTAAPVLSIGIALLGTAWLLFTGFLVTIIAQAFAPNPWNYAISFILVTVVYAVVGGLAAYLAWRQLKQKGVKPERTIRVLQQDRIWLQTEGKSQI
ncbi:MAG TPA: phage holin family protein [Terriglobales bacterium]|nr:phage holin family protein [Terriglobales bacterium]